MTDSLAFDIKKIRVAIAIAFCAIALSSYGYYLSNAYLEDQKRHESALNQERLSLRARKHEATEQLRVLDTMLDRYHQLVQFGTFKPDTRLEWIENIEEAGFSKRIPTTTYTLQARASHPLPGNHTAAGLGFYKTNIKLDMMMLHEGDLVSSYDYFSGSQLGLFSFEKCDVKRVADQINETTLEPLLSASCEIATYNYIFNDDNQDELLAMDAPI